MKRIQKWPALFMAVTLLFTLAAPAALAAESTVTIKTAEDLAELSRNCTLDTWSQGKTVILKNDLDLHGIDFTPIPTFSGTFQGNGHTISGLTLTGSGNVPLHSKRRHRSGSDGHRHHPPQWASGCSGPAGRQQRRADLELHRLRHRHG